MTGEEDLLKAEAEDLRVEVVALKADNAALLGVATDLPKHDYQGLCPDESQPESRDPECPACAVLLAPHPGSALLERMRKMEDALRTIARWDRSTFPRVPDTTRPGETKSYGVAYGSNGERDFMRQIALNALEKK